MRGRWPALAASAALAVLAVPILASCGDDDDAPSDPTVTLFEPEPNPRRLDGDHDLTTGVVPRSAPPA